MKDIALLQWKTLDRQVRVWSFRGDKHIFEWVEFLICMQPIRCEPKSHTKCVIRSLSTDSPYGSHIWSLFLDISLKGFSIPEKYTICFSYIMLLILLLYLHYCAFYEDIYLAHTRHMDICFTLALQFFFVMVCAEQVLALSVCMMMLLCFRLISESKCMHKLARLPIFKGNTLINFRWLWNVVFCLNSAAAHRLNFFFISPFFYFTSILFPSLSNKSTFLSDLHRT